ncbi:MAG: hypothetical protein QOE96_87 [Blastocatellia bacterium]|jgi:hypothetical protein|nr:hypothetical protein [Blastocatellia bacterium]
MANGISIHVGVNNLDPLVFNILLLPGLKGCENDAREMFNIAKNRFNFMARDPFLGPNAKFENVVPAILAAAAELENGGIFLFTFSGHGSQRPDTNHDEADGKDEGIVLFDRILIDDFLRRNLWSQFKPGVRIVGVADCCHGGTALFASLLGPHEPVGLPIPGPITTHTSAITMSALSAQPSAAVAPRVENLNRASMPQEKEQSRGERGPWVPPPSPRLLSATGMTTEAKETKGNPIVREISNTVRDDHFGRLPDFYDKLDKSLLTGDDATLKADLLTLSACQDMETTPDGEPNGQFTQALLEVLKAESLPASYDDFLWGIEDNLRRKGLTPPPTPVLTPDAPKPEFRAQQPFRIEVDL